MEYTKIYKKYYKYKQKYYLTKTDVLTLDYIFMLNSIIYDNILLLYSYFNSKLNFDIETIKIDLIKSIEDKLNKEIINNLKDKYNISRYIMNYFSETFRIKKIDQKDKNDNKLKLDIDKDDTIQLSKFTTFDSIHNYIKNIANKGSYINFDEYLLLEYKKNSILMDIIRYKNYPQYLLTSDSDDNILIKLNLDKPLIIIPLKI
jgi:hypothetical protein